MRYHVGQRDLRALHRTLDVLLDPLRYERLDDWRAAATREIADLLGADMGTFYLSTSEGPPVYTAGLSMDFVMSYGPRRQTWDHRYGIDQRELELGVFSRPMLYAPCLDEYYRSEYWNDFMVPQRAFDAINLAVRTTDGSVARLIFHHERPTGRKFGRRALGLLALLRPAFSGGVEMRQELGGFQDRFLAMVDALPHGIRLCDPSGRIAHQNPVLSALLADSAIRQALTVALDDITHRMRTDPIHGGLDPSHALTTVISVPAGMLRVRGSRATLEPHMRGWILLATEPISRSLPSPATVAAAFRLTRQQSRVALMLGAGASNAEIASALGISPHTARHHTESVVLRLGINSRGLVRSRLESASNH